MSSDIIGSELMRRAARFKTGDYRGVDNLDLHLRLFVNDIHPDCFASIGDFVECTTPGYAELPLPLAAWTYTQYPTGSSCGWQASASPHTFNFDVTGETIYGLFVAEVRYGFVAWSKVFDMPYVIPVGGGSLQIQPNVRDVPCA